MDLTTLLKAFAAEAGLGDLHQNSRGGCVLAVRNDGKIIIEPSESAQWAYFSGLMCPTPQSEDGRLNLYRTLLHYHGKNLKTLPYCFAESLVLEHVIMSQRMALKGMTQEKFNNTVVQFVQNYLYWRDELASGRLSPEAPDSPAPPDAGFTPSGALRL